MHLTSQGIWLPLVSLYMYLQKHGTWLAWDLFKRSGCACLLLHRTAAFELPASAEEYCCSSNDVVASYLQTQDCKSIRLLLQQPHMHLMNLLMSATLSLRLWR